MNKMIIAILLCVTHLTFTGINKPKINKPEPDNSPELFIRVGYYGRNRQVPRDIDAMPYIKKSLEKYYLTELADSIITSLKRGAPYTHEGKACHTFSTIREVIDLVKTTKDFYNPKAQLNLKEEQE